MSCRKLTPQADTLKLPSIWTVAWNKLRALMALCPEGVLGWLLILPDHCASALCLGSRLSPWTPVAALSLSWPFCNLPTGLCEVWYVV